MNADRKPTLISPEDRKRQQIAALYSLNGSTQYGINGLSSEEPTALPVFLSAAETISLIAYGWVTALDGPAPGAPDIYGRWKVHVTGPSPDERQYPLVRELRLVLARVHWWKVQKRSKAPPAKCPIPALGSDYRAQVRWAIRKSGMTAVQTLALLRKDVRLLLAAQAERNAAMDRATGILCAEVGAERLVALGRPGTWRKLTRTGTHEPIPSEFFANPHVTVLLTGWITCSPRAPAWEWINWIGPDWGDVRFKRDEVKALLHRLQPGRFEANAVAVPAHGADTRQMVQPDCLTTARFGSGRIGAPERGRLAIPNKPGTGGRKATGAKEAMIEAVKDGRISFEQLRRMKQKRLADIYPAGGRTLLAECREIALAALLAERSDKSPPTNDK
jgi:hypothetical protein